MQFIDNYPLKNITTLEIGGPAKKFVTVSSVESLIEAIKFAKEQKMPFLVIGSGSNLLISDDGFDGLVIKNEITGISHIGCVILSGTPLQELVNYTINQGLSGVQKLTGIHGTAGGAVFGNAGAYGQSISDHISNVKVLDPNDLTIKQFNNADCQFAYRDSIFKKNHFIILEITLQLEQGNPETQKKEAEEILSKRLIKYPPGIKCPGSFFKNLVAADLPPQILKNIPADKIVFGKVPAGTLLEMTGAKGQCSNGIEIAPYHANLFINKGRGTAKDFYNLAKTYAQKVKEKFGISLEPEVQLINLPPLI